MFQELNGKSLFITGGTGLFGRWLLNYLQAVNVKVVVLSRNPGVFIKKYPEISMNSNFEFIEGNVRDFVFPKGRFDYVIHAATEASSKSKNYNENEVYFTITEGTRRVIEFSMEKEVKRFLYISSGAVYGIQPPEISHIREDFQCKPVTSYGRGKYEAEQICIKSGLYITIARCFAFMGPWFPLNSNYAIGNFIGNCLRNEPISINGDGRPLRSYMFSSDLVEWLLSILISGRKGEVYNVGSDEEISIRDLAYLVRDCYGVASPVVIKQAHNPSLLPPRYVPSIVKAQDDLNLSLRVKLYDAICKTISLNKRKVYGIE